MNLLRRLSNWTLAWFLLFTGALLIFWPGKGLAGVTTLVGCLGTIVTLTGLAALIHVIRTRHYPTPHRAFYNVLLAAPLALLAALAIGTAIPTSSEPTPTPTRPTPLPTAEATRTRAAVTVLPTNTRRPSPTATVTPTSPPTRPPTVTFPPPTARPTLTPLSTRTPTRRPPTATRPAPTQPLAQPTATLPPSPPQPTTTLPPPPPSSPTATLPPPPPPPTATQPPAAICDCSGDLYNCSDFNTHAAAQNCFDYCMQQTGRDVHNLDNDGDGIACESLP